MECISLAAQTTPRYSTVNTLPYAPQLGTSLLCLFFHLLCYAAVLKILTYYAQYYTHVKMICAY